MMDVKISKHISRWFDREKLINIRWNSIKKPWRKTEKVRVIDRGKEECINFEIRIRGKSCRLVLLYGSPSQLQGNLEAFANNFKLNIDTATVNNTFLTIFQLFKS